MTSLLHINLNSYPITLSYNSLLIYLNQTGAKDSISCNSICCRKWPSAVRHSRNRQAISKRSWVKWKLSLEGNSKVLKIDLNVLKLLDNRGVLLVNPDKGQAGAVRVPRTGNSAGGNDNAELDVLRLGLDVLSFNDERVEDGEVDCANVGAGAGNNEVLVQRREGEFACACCQKWNSAGDFVCLESKESVLFAFLTDN